MRSLRPGVRRSRSDQPHRRSGRSRVTFYHPTRAFALHVEPKRNRRRSKIAVRCRRTGGGSEQRCQNLSASGGCSRAQIYRRTQDNGFDRHASIRVSGPNKAGETPSAALVMTSRTPPEALNPQKGNIMLTRTTYVGRHRFNTRFWKTRQRKSEMEVVEMAVPPIIDAAEFEAVQTLLKSRSPALTAPRIVSGPTLLTGICFCTACGKAMTLRTGKGGRYRYYTCSTKARQGETGCPRRTVPMEKLDTLVADHIEQRLLQPKRLEEILSSVLGRREERAERRTAHIAELRKRASEADAKLKRLYDAIENGVADLSDPMLKNRIAELKAIRDQARADAERAEDALERLGPSITPQALKTFARQARKRMRTEGGGYRRDHLRALAQRVEVDTKEVRILGSKSVLLRTLVAASSANTAGFGVTSFVPKWRARKDSNL